MTAEKLANIIHMIELAHRKPDFHETLGQYGLNVMDWSEMLGGLQKWYENLRASENTPQARAPKLRILTHEMAQ